MKTQGAFKALLSGSAAFVFFCGCHPSGNSNPPATVTPVTDTVIISGMKFNPEELYVHPSDTVLWINEDIVTHNVTKYPGEEWTSGALATGASWKRVMNDSASYFCSIHPTMRAKVLIKP